MPATVAIGQKWSVWVPGRRQWLLSTVIRQSDGVATLKFDTRYWVRAGDDEQAVDESALLERSSLFRFVEP